MTPGTFTRDEREGVSYFVGEIQPEKYYGLFSLTDDDAAGDQPAFLEYVGDTVDQCLAVLKDTLSPKKVVKKSAPAEKPADDQPAVRRPRKKPAAG